MSHIKELYKRLKYDYIRKQISVSDKYTIHFMESLSSDEITQITESYNKCFENNIYGDFFVNNSEKKHNFIVRDNETSKIILFFTLFKEDDDPITRNSCYSIWNVCKCDDSKKNVFSVVIDGLRKTFTSSDFYLKVLSENYHAYDVYKKIGFQEIKKSHISYLHKPVFQNGNLIKYKVMSYVAAVNST